MASTDEQLSASLTDPLMGNNVQHLKDESRPGDRLALYTALVRSSPLSPNSDP
jgi:hypothetical protein